MSNGNINPALTGAPGPLPGAAPGQPGAPGVSSSFRGEQVSLLPTAEAILADSMEEMTFSFSEVTQKKEIAERNLRSGVRKLSEELMHAYLERVPDLNQNGALREFVKALAAETRPVSVAAFLQHAERHFDDPSHAFSALSFAVELLEQEEPGSETLANARQARDIFHERHAEAIDAGLNIAREVTRPDYERLGKPQQLRDAYRDVVLDYDSIGKAYERITADFPGKPMAEAISFLLASLSADIHASRADSGRSLRLRRIVDDLYQVKQLNTLHSSCERLLQRCHKQYQSKPPQEDALVDNMLAITIELKDAEWQSDKVLDKALDCVGVNEPEACIYFLQGYKEIARLMPMKLFSDTNQRERMLASVQQRIDFEIDNEAEPE